MSRIWSGMVTPNASRTRLSQTDGRTDIASTRPVGFASGKNQIARQPRQELFRIVRSRCYPEPAMSISQHVHLYVPGSSRGAAGSHNFERVLRLCLNQNSQAQLLESNCRKRGHATTLYVPIRWGNFFP